MQQYLQGRYIRFTEAIWRLFQFGMHDEYLSVMHLASHLLGEQPVYFHENTSANHLHDQMESAPSTLLAFFESNTLNLDERQYLYQDLPTYYTYSVSLRK